MSGGKRESKVRGGDKNKSIHIVDTFSTPRFFSAAIEQMANQTSKIPRFEKASGIPRKDCRWPVLVTVMCAHYPRCRAK